MDDPTEPSIEVLAAQTTITDYSDFRMVSIPGFATLSAAKRSAVLDKALQRQMAGPEYAEKLTSRLMDMTPPIDEEEEIEEARFLEAQARKELEEDGCPPCYPPDLDFPLQNPPEKYQAIIRYWESFPGTDEVVLCAQRSDWWKFRRCQERSRARHRNKGFGNFVDEVRERRKRHAVGGDARLLLNPKQQSWQETWAEFQDYQLRRLEGFEKKRDELKQESDDAQKKPEVSRSAAEDVEFIQIELETAERYLKRHKILLQWIEQERQMMETRYLTPAEEDDRNQDPASKAVRRTAHDCRRRRPGASAVIGNVRITKAKPKKGKTPVQEAKDLGSEQPKQAPAVAPPSSTSQTRKRRETPPRRPKEDTSLGSVHPSRVSKAQRYTKAKTPLRTQRRGAGQNRDANRTQSTRPPVPRRSQPAPTDAMTRTGRISRPPVRWAPE